MRTATLLAALLLAAAPAGADDGHRGLRVEGPRLVAPDGETVVLRGVNEMSVWIDRAGERSVPAIAATGANAMRIVWLATEPPAELAALAARAAGHGMIPVVELHDATCRPLDGPEFRRIMDWWTRADVRAALAPLEDVLIVNVANEAGREPPDRFAAAYADAVRRLRAAGWRAPLMVDAGGCGQDIAGLRAAWRAIADADPLRRTLFSVHPYWTAAAGWTRGRVLAELEGAAAEGMPLVLGELSPYAYRCAPVDWALLAGAAQRLGLGWLAWSWGPGNRDCPRMDMTDDFETLTETGRLLVESRPYGIRATAVRPAFLDARAAAR